MKVRPLANGHHVWLDALAMQSRWHPERGIARFAVQHASSIVRAGVPIGGIGLHEGAARPVDLPPELRDHPALTVTSAASVRRAADAAPLIHHVLSPYEPYPPSRLFAPPLSSSGAHLVCTVYDLIPDRFPDRYLADGRMRRTFAARRATLERADLLLCISESTRLDVLDLFDVDPARCVVVGAGASSYFCPAPPDATPAAPPLPTGTRPFVLCVSGYEWRKNTTGLLDAWSRLPRSVRSDVVLAVACSLPDAGRAEWSAHAESLGIEDEVVFTGEVSDEVLRSLYRSARLVVQPSLYEGFGLPIVEAARCGALVITSDRSSMPEVLAEPSSTFDPDDPDAIAAAIERGLFDEEHRSVLSDAGAVAARRHTWDQVGERTVRAYELLPRQHHCRPRRPRIALVGPLPPVLSGVASYNARLLCALDRRADVARFVEPALDARPGRRRSHGGWGLQHLGSSFDPHQFDAMVHVLGNSDCHVETAAIAERGGGIVWLHDTFLGGLAIQRAVRAAGGAHGDDARAIMLDAIERAYPGEAPGAVLREPLDLLTHHRARMWWTRPFVRDARAVIVSSREAEAIVRADNELAAHLPPIHVVPLAVPRRRPRPPRDEDGRIVLASFGIQSPLKQPLKLLDAVRRLGRTDVDVRFVGPCDVALEKAIRERAAALGLERTTSLTGFVDEPTYERLLTETTVAVQLREHSNGEASAAVIDALACGVPVVTSVHSATELDTEAVLEVDPAATPDVVAGAIDAAIAGWDDLHRSARRYAASWGDDDVAAALVDIVASAR